MRTVTASEAHENWFALLDEVVRGEVVLVEREGGRVVLRREENETTPGAAPPDYHDLLQVPNVDDADRWTWEWCGPEQGLIPRILAREPESER